MMFLHREMGRALKGQVMELSRQIIETPNALRWRQFDGPDARGLLAHACHFIGMASQQRHAPDTMPEITCDRHGKQRGPKQFQPEDLEIAARVPAMEKAERENQPRAEIVNDTPRFIFQLDDATKAREQHMDEHDQKRDSTKPNVPLHPRTQDE